jgi:hypothetical protein
MKKFFEWSLGSAAVLSFSHPIPLLQNPKSKNPPVLLQFLPIVFLAAFFRISNTRHGYPHDGYFHGLKVLDGLSPS